MYFDMKNTLKNNRNHTPKQTLSLRLHVGQVNLDEFKIALF
jgi:hypothetical protein